MVSNTLRGRSIQAMLTCEGPGFLRATTLPTDKDLRISLCSYKALATQITYVMMILRHPDQRDSLILFPGNLLGPRMRPTFGKEIEAPLPPSRPRCTFIHPKQLSRFLERLELLFSSDEIWSGYEDNVSSGTDQFTAWVKMDFHDTLVQSFTCAKAVQHLQLEPKAASRLRRCLQKADRRQMTCHHATRSS